MFPLANVLPALDGPRLVVQQQRIDVSLGSGDEISHQKSLEASGFLRLCGEVGHCEQDWLILG